jgi:hypothetical protein
VYLFRLIDRALFRQSDHAAQFHSHLLLKSFKENCLFLLFQFIIIQTCLTLDPTTSSSLRLKTRRFSKVDPSRTAYPTALSHADLIASQGFEWNTPKVRIT